MDRRNVVIDCDTGVDDALALLLALRSPAFNVLGITTLAGNVGLDKVVRNTLIVVEQSGTHVPVYRGTATALLGPGYTAEYVHGGDGLGDIGFSDPQATPADGHAVDFLIQTFMDATEPVELITLGPLTNVAMALIKEPRLEERIPSLLMMAGGITNGNSTAAAEFNIYVDPEAADIVFRSRVPKTMVALEPIRDGATLAPEDVQQIEARDTPWCQMAGRLLRFQLDRYQQAFGEPMPVSPPDPGAMAVAIDQGLAESEMYHVAIETKGQHTRGMTLVDRRHWRGKFRPSPEANVRVVNRIDQPAYRSLWLDGFAAS